MKLHDAFCLLAFNKTQWSTLVIGRYMITMMVLLCYVNLSGMSLECIVIVLMNNLLLGGQFCTDSVNVQQEGRNPIGRNRLAIIPRLNFTCNGRIVSIRATVNFDSNPDRTDYLFFQVWRQVVNTSYNKIGEVQLQSDDQLSEVNYDVLVANITLTGNNTIEVRSGDVVGYYHPPQARYRVRTILTNGYLLYQFDGSHESVDLTNYWDIHDYRQPLIQFIVGKFIDYFNNYNYHDTTLLKYVCS